MAFLFQIRALKKDVQRHLDDLKDSEKGDSSATSSGDISPQHDQSSEDGKDKFANTPYARLPGIEARTFDDGTQNYIVSWSSPDDQHNPHNWSTAKRMKTTILLFSIAFVVTAASSADSAVLMPAAKALKVSEVTEALGGTGIFLIGFGCGSLLFSPLSEIIGRYPTYLGSLTIFGIWLMASALSPNIGAQIIFRYLAGLCSSAPLTVAGGSISDVWNPKVC